MTGERYEKWKARHDAHECGDEVMGIITAANFGVQDRGFGFWFDICTRELTGFGWTVLGLDAWKLVQQAGADPAKYVGRPCWVKRVDHNLSHFIELADISPYKVRKIEEDEEEPAP